MITPPCDSPGCKQPSVHRVEVAIGVYVTNGKAWGWKHLCVPCFAAYERKVWGNA